ncbi:MAG TPA: orotidine-5'-phosphate decarboxylase [Candidatus Bilophila faecipullorum]|uniref:Orotidine 5'-phosphate decarboxylase n=4 Tax=Bilophila TaxID=35832 RepID=A0A9D1QZ68_9BACT|nr:orotidine-5'-phosphate decarboxylase [uncultured Bilophila sp.]HIW78077.1 orotidine-5'-phosphate decarboxylase [Candidatus Bilophila faecipullorum]
MAQLIAALDYTNAADALATANALRGCPIWMKVGLELFTHEGPSVAARLKEMGFKVMLDLKMFDIPNTVKGGVRSACLMGVDLITVHALGGERMIRAAREAIEESAASGGARPLLFAVTVLTSMAPGELPGYGEDLPGLAADLAAGGQAWGLDGVVCSGHEVETIKRRCPSLLCLTPGIRPASGSTDDQRRVMTPAQAVRAGSDFLVVGRPITKAPVPADAARAILDEMEKA